MKIKINFFDSILGMMLLLVSTSVMSEEYIVDQKGQEFSEGSISIQTGDTIKFTNSDPMYHNIYSLSETDTFDLGAYGKGDSRSFTFNNKGIVDVECVIHPFMKLEVKVK